MTISHHMDDIINEAVIVAAHPDDEILWFSSIIDRVKQVVICFLRQDSRPDWTAGRSEALAQYPLSNTSCLNLELSEVFNRSDWQFPRKTPYGLDIDSKGCFRQNYEANYRRLKKRLQGLLRPYNHVFTHNPWGEYGHEEHVQVFRAIENLQSEMGFTLWVSNYVSNRSVPLMLNSMTTIGHHFFNMKTNKAIAAQIMDLYIKNECWTWYPGFEWRDEETFLQVNPLNQRKRRIGRAFPVNILDIGEVGTSSPLFKKTEKIVRRVCRTRNSFFRNMSR